MNSKCTYTGSRDIKFSPPKDNIIFRVHLIIIIFSSSLYLLLELCLLFILLLSPTIYFLDYLSLMTSISNHDSSITRTTKKRDPSS